MGWSFDGTDYVTIADNAALTVPAGDYSFVGWFRVSSNAGTSYPRLLAWGTAGGTPHIQVFLAQSGLGVENADHLGARVIDPSGKDTAVIYPAGLALSSVTDQWLAWCLTYDYSAKTHYLRILDRSANTYYTDSSAGGLYHGAINIAEPMYLGANSGGNQFTGDMSDVAFVPGVYMDNARFHGFIHGGRPYRFPNCAWYVPMIGERYAEEWRANLTVARTGTGVSAAVGNPQMQLFTPRAIHSDDIGVASPQTKFKPLVIDSGRIKQLQAGEQLEAGVTLPDSTGDPGEVLVANADGNPAWTDPPFFFEADGPTADGQVLQATGADAASWTTDIDGLTSLTVDDIEINGLRVDAYGRANSSTASAQFLFRRSRGSEGSETTVRDGDRLGTFSFLGHDGTDFGTTAVGVFAYVDGTVASNSVPGELVIEVLPEGETSRIDALIVRSSGDVELPSGGLSLVDNEKVLLGDSQDASIYYNGSHLVIDPKEVGSGILDVLGTIQTDGYNSADGTAGATADVAVAKVGGGTRTLNFKNGLYTGYTDS